MCLWFPLRAFLLRRKLRCTISQPLSAHVFEMNDCRFCDSFPDPESRYDLSSHVPFTSCSYCLLPLSIYFSMLLAYFFILHSDSYLPPHNHSFPSPNVTSPISLLMEILVRLRGQKTVLQRGRRWWWWSSSSSSWWYSSKPMLCFRVHTLCLFKKDPKAGAISSIAFQWHSYKNLKKNTGT